MNKFKRQVGKYIYTQTRFGVWGGNVGVVSFRGPKRMECKISVELEDGAPNQKHRRFGIKSHTTSAPPTCDVTQMNKNKINKYEWKYTDRMREVADLPTVRCNMIRNIFFS